MKNALIDQTTRRRTTFAFPVMVGVIVVVSLWGSGGRVCAPQGALESLFGLVAPQSAMAMDGGGMEGKMAPAWKLKTLDGKQVSSKDFEGKVVLVDFWATWCPPCVRGIPDLMALQEAYGAKGLAVVGISLDDRDSDVKKFIKEKSVNYTVVMGNEEVAGEFGGISSIPTAFLIDRTGKIVWQHVGLADKAELEKRIAELL